MLVNKLKIPFILFSILLILSFKKNNSISNDNQLKQENHSPVVKIIVPQNNSSYEWNKLVRYKISVSDKEDGESKYKEISSKEVFLKVKYVPDLSKIVADKSLVEQISAGFKAIESSNCFNCHQFKTKSIAPSFYAINKRYSHTRSNIALLAKHIREGCKGIWGNASMPSHLKLTDKEARNIVQWVFKNADDPTLNYYVGLQGTFSIKSLDTPDKNGVLMLTASYTDHGLKDDPDNKLTGYDRVTIYATKK